MNGFEVSIKSWISFIASKPPITVAASQDRVEHEEAEDHEEEEEEEEEEEDDDEDDEDEEVEEEDVCWRV
jgi:ribosomal protein L12E/L44/L45/RPP1/RPP2